MAEEGKLQVDIPLADIADQGTGMWMKENELI